jgi:hypothetical protein
MPDRTLSHAVFTAPMDVPIEKVDIADWLFHLPSPEYQRCAPPDHIAAGATTTDDGRPMSINVETIGDSLVVQQYIGEVTTPTYCRMVSQSDTFTPRGRTKVQVVWELSATRVDDTTSEYRNVVTATATDEFLTFIAEHGVSFEDAAKARSAASTDHCSRETPLYARSIAAHARARA